MRIKEIFYSIQGESTSQGLPTVFVRLSGCPLRCHYCDTAYAFTGGEQMSSEQVLKQIGHYPTSYVTVTGGEPLAQTECLPLLTLLCDHTYEVSLETSGALSVEQVDARVRKIIDFKTPSSGEVSKNHWQNVAFLQARDEVKFVVGNRRDYDWALMQIDLYQLQNRVNTIWFSPVCGELPPGKLADWIVSSGIQVRLQIQLHKILWGNMPGK